MNTAFPTIPTAPVTQVFDFYNPKRYGSGKPYHKGIDYGVLPGTPVYACMDGVVHTAVTLQAGYGRHVKLTHADGSMSVYGHLTRLLVAQGDTVEAGQPIGLSGGDPNDSIDGDGNSSGAHLHWEIRPPGGHGSDQNAVDPMEWCLRHQPPELFTRCIVTAYGGLNVRSEPNARAKKLHALFNKQTVYVEEMLDGWARLRSLRPEWVHAAYLDVMDDQTQPPFHIDDMSAPTTPATPDPEERIVRVTIEYNSGKVETLP